MSILPLLLSNSDKSPWVPVERRNVRRRPHQAASAALHVAQDYASVGLPVFLVVPGGKRLRTPHNNGDATTDLAQIRRCRSRCLTASIGVRLLQNLGRTRSGQL